MDISGYLWIFWLCLVPVFFGFSYFCWSTVASCSVPVVVGSRSKETEIAAKPMADEATVCGGPLGPLANKAICLMTPDNM